MTVTEVLEYALIDGGNTAAEELEFWRRLNVLADVEMGWNAAKYHSTPISSLSPGCALRAYLAIAIERLSVELLLLDEPTNHLDLPSIVWLERTIQKSAKSFIIVSHDGAFLDAVTNRIWEVDRDGRFNTLVSDYSTFKYNKLLAIEQQREAHYQQKKTHQKLTAAADRLKHASKKGERFESRDHDTLQRDFKRDRAGRSGKRAAALIRVRDSEEKIEEVIDHVPLRLRLDPPQAGFDSSILVDEVKIGHIECGALLLPSISLRLDFGERIALVGPNGIGKSTLLKTICGELNAISGSVVKGRELRLGNLMQEHSSLPQEVSPRDYVESMSNMERFAAGNRVISYGLTRHQVGSPIGQLNPGARARLLLATFALRKVNLLVLDEPTNHLDEEAIAEVVASLNDFKGSVIVVSHDREFLNSLALTRIYHLSESGLCEMESLDSYSEKVGDIVEQVLHNLSH